MNLSTLVKQPGTEPGAARYVLWRRKTNPDTAFPGGAELGERELMGRVVYFNSLGYPMLYATPEGEIYRTTKVETISRLDEDSILVRTRNSEYILSFDPGR